MGKELEFSKELVVRQNWYACMFVEVSEVFVTANDVVNRDALCHRKEIEVFRVADVRMGLDGDVCKETDIIDHFEEVVTSLSRDEFVEFLSGYDAAYLIEFLLADIDLHVMTAQYIGQ